MQSALSLPVFRNKSPRASNKLNFALVIVSYRAEIRTQFDKIYYASLVIQTIYVIRIVVSHRVYITLPFSASP